MADSGYWRVRRLPSGGTFTPGADWAAQFDTDTTVLVSAAPSSSGEVMVQESTIEGTVSVLGGDFSVPAGRGLVVPDFLEIPAGVHFEIGAGGVLEIT